MSITACELRGNAQKAQETRVGQEEPKDQKTPENVKTEWVEYEPAVVELEGTLSIKMFFGPPNFGEEPKTDSKEMTRILSLDKPINVLSKDETNSVLGPSVKNVRELQLVFNGPLRKWVGKKLRVKGTLFHAHTGHHHTDVLLTVESISLAEAKPRGGYWIRYGEASLAAVHCGKPRRARLRSHCGEMVRRGALPDAVELNVDALDPVWPLPG